MSDGLVSTIIPVHNRARLVGTAVASVLSQDYPLLEVLVVDDGSTDETPAVLAALAAADHRVRMLSQANAGPGAAREAGRREARGEFIQYLDSDDVLLPGKFSAQVAALRAQPDAGASYGPTLLRDRSGRVVAKASKRTGEKIDAMFPAFLVERWWDTPTPLYRRAVTDAAGPWTDLRLEEDWEYDCRIASFGTRLAFVDQPVCEHRDHAGERLSRGEALDPQRLRDRARSHSLILGHARAAGIRHDAHEMQRFSRSLFLLARQCGAARLESESRALFALAQEACGQERASGLDFRLYRAAAAVAGWTAAGSAALWFDGLRRTA